MTWERAAVWWGMVKVTVFVVFGLGLTRGQALILSLVASLFLIAVGVCVVTHG